MPFTPIHMGAAAAFKLAGSTRFSFTMFGYSQILIDLEPLVRLARGDAAVHGLSHTYAGAAAIALLAALTGKPLCEKGLTQWNRMLRLEILRVPTHLTWLVSFASAYLGTFSHVALDSIMHADMRPVWPFGETNALYGLISTTEVHLLCLLLGALGGIGLCLVWVWRRWSGRI